MMNNFNRRQFLLASSSIALSGMPFSASHAAAASPNKLLVMVYLKGGSDAYNTLAPFTNSRYYQFRPNIALKRENLIHFNELERGGHFAALEQPIAFVEEVRATFSGLR